MAHAMVLCAGLGTRLRPLTDELPKPLVPIGDRSILAHIAAALSAQGIRSWVINTHHLPREFPLVLEQLNAEVQVTHEPQIRGTAGGVAGARALLSAPLVVWNGDVLVAEPQLAELLQRAETGGLTLLVAPRAAGEGTVGVDGAGRVVRLRGERFGDERLGGDYVGVAGIGQRCLATLPELGCLIGDWALPELRAGRAIDTVVTRGAWTDAGGLAAYHAANVAWLDRHCAGAAWVAESARVDGTVRLSRSIVGAGATVLGSGELQRVVVWPGARATAPLSDAVVTRAGHVVRL